MDLNHPGGVRVALRCGIEYMSYVEYQSTDAIFNYNAPFLLDVFTPRKIELDEQAKTELTPCELSSTEEMLRMF
jgi:hypothetical protein